MERHVTATDARVNFGDVLRGVSERGEVVIVERGGTPQAVVISVTEYHRLKRGSAGPDVPTTLRELHELIRIEGNQPLIPPPEDVIRQGRQDRDAQIQDSLR